MMDYLKISNYSFDLIPMERKNNYLIIESNQRLHSMRLTFNKYNLDFRYTGFGRDFIDNIIQPPTDMKINLTNDAYRDTLQYIYDQLEKTVIKHINKEIMSQFVHNGNEIERVDL